MLAPAKACKRNIFPTLECLKCVPVTLQYLLEDLSFEWDLVSFKGFYCKVQSVVGFLLLLFCGWVEHSRLAAISPFLERVFCNLLGTF